MLEYLDGLARHTAKLRGYYPDHLRMGEAGETSFEAVRQTVRVVEDRPAFGRWQIAEMERSRRRELPSPPAPVAWDERAGARFGRAIILGDPG